MNSASSSSVSGVHSEAGSTEVKPKLNEEKEVLSENTEIEKLKCVPVEDAQFVAMDSLENKEKYEKYAADYTRYLTDKYFSDKTIFGGNIYDVKVTADGQTVKSSRLPPYQSYLDPAGFHDLLNSVAKSDKVDPADATTIEKAT